MMLEYPARRALYREALLAFLRDQHDLYLLTEMHGNIGDHLIWAGTRDLLASGAIEIKECPLKGIDAMGDAGGTLLVPGSGAFDLLWHEWLPDTVHRASEIFKKVIVLPSSFDVSVPEVVRCLSRPNVFAFAREAASYAAIKSLGRAALGLDLAVYYRRFDDAALPLPGGAPERLLVALRKDKGSLLRGYGVGPNSELNEDISQTRHDLDDWMGAIESSSTVVTDRLHVAIAAALRGKKVFYLDPYKRKISTHFNYTFRDHFNGSISPCSIEWLLEKEYVLPLEAAA